MYVQNNWQVKYLANLSKIVVGVTLIWRKAVAVSKHNSYIPEMASFKCGGVKDNPPNRQIKHFANYSVYTVLHIDIDELLFNHCFAAIFIPGTCLVS